MCLVVDYMSVDGSRHVVHVSQPFYCSFQQIVNAAKPGSLLALFFRQVVNAAKPANDILDFLHNDMFDVLPEDSDADLIIVDFGVNDAIIEHFDYDVNNVK